MRKREDESEEREKLPSEEWINPCSTVALPRLTDNRLPCTNQQSRIKSEREKRRLKERESLPRLIAASPEPSPQSPKQYEDERVDSILFKP